MFSRLTRCTSETFYRNVFIQWVEGVGNSSGGTLLGPAMPLHKVGVFQSFGLKPGTVMFFVLSMVFKRSGKH